MARKKLRLAVLISGRGRTLKNLIDVIGRGELDAEICVVIASSKNSSGLQYAEENKDDGSAWQQEVRNNEIFCIQHIFSRHRMETGKNVITQNAGN